MSVRADFWKSSSIWSQTACNRTGWLWLTICQNQNESVKDRTPFLPLLIFSGIEDECRRASFQTTIWSRQGRKQWMCAGWLYLPLFPLQNFGMNFSPKWIWLCVGWSFSVWLLRGDFPLSFHLRLSFFMDELSPTTNYKTSPRSWAVKMPCCLKGVMSVLLWYSPFSNLSKGLFTTGLQKNKLLEYLLGVGWGTVLFYTPLLGHFAFLVYGTYSSMLKRFFLS